jgi:hypothetical protein
MIEYNSISALLWFYWPVSETKRFNSRKPDSIATNLFKLLIIVSAALICRHRFMTRRPGHFVFRWRRDSRVHVIDISWAKNMTSRFLQQPCVYICWESLLDRMLCKAQVAVCFSTWRSHITRKSRDIDVRRRQLNPPQPNRGGKLVAQVRYIIFLWFDKWNKSCLRMNISFDNL